MALVKETEVFFFFLNYLLKGSYLCERDRDSVSGGGAKRE